MSSEAALVKRQPPPHDAAMRTPRSILITGASSGIGAALARAYAAPGVTLALCGRDAARLDAVALSCEERGAKVQAALVDVTDGQACARWIDDADSIAPLDLVVANAGVSAGTSGGEGFFRETAETVRRIFAINVDGVLNTVLPAIPVMRARGRGQIAIMSSLAAFVGSPGAAAYCATKAAGRLYGEALRRELGKDGVEVSVVCPGFVRTPLTEKNDFYMPLAIDADRAARIIQRGLRRNRPRIAFPWPMYALVWLGAALPAGLTDSLMRRLGRNR
jgi:short-subunit dehydrogenase